MTAMGNTLSALRMLKLLAGAVSRTDITAGSPNSKLFLLLN
jgi:hypothetical protein